MATGSSLENVIDQATLIAWADIVQQKWEMQIIKYNINDTTSLFNSLQHFVLREGNGDLKRVDFFFNLYGIYVDMGVGNGYTIGNSGDMLADKGWIPQRQARRWYSTMWYAQVRRLSEIIAEKTGRKAARLIAGVIYNAMNDKLNKYRRDSNARSSRNYSRRRMHDNYIPGKTMLTNHNFDGEF